MLIDWPISYISFAKELIGNLEINNTNSNSIPWGLGPTRFTSVSIYAPPESFVGVVAIATVGSTVFFLRFVKDNSMLGAMKALSLIANDF